MAYAREAETKKGMDEAQITGSASSYARKYALNGLFAIDDTKDPDTQDNSKAITTPTANPVLQACKNLALTVGNLTPQQREEKIRNAYEVVKKNPRKEGQAMMDRLASTYGVVDPAEIPEEVG